jgi:hypothetical protein
LKFGFGCYCRKNLALSSSAKVALVIVALSLSSLYACKKNSESLFYNAQIMILKETQIGLSDRETRYIIFIKMSMHSS